MFEVFSSKPITGFDSAGISVFTIDGLLSATRKEPLWTESANTATVYSKALWSNTEG